MKFARLLELLQVQRIEEDQTAGKLLCTDDQWSVVQNFDGHWSIVHIGISSDAKDRQ